MGKKRIRHEGTKERRKHEELNLWFSFVVPSSLRAFVSLLFITIAALCNVAHADFRFVHISDPHVGAGENHITDAKLFKEISDLDPKPAFVVATGDICEIGTPAQYSQFLDALKNL